MTVIVEKKNYSVNKRLQTFTPRAETILDDLKLLL